MRAELVWVQVLSRVGAWENIEGARKKTDVCEEVMQELGRDMKGMWERGGANVIKREKGCVCVVFERGGRHPKTSLSTIQTAN